jgi:tetratricopeptide (TPR) repeat protein
MGSEWTKLIDASSAEIHRRARDLALTRPLLSYAEILSSYLQGDVEKLRELCANLRLEDEPIRALALLRLAIRRRDVKSKDLHALATREFAGALEGEKWFCSGLAWELLENDTMANSSFIRAAAVYRAEGCPGKALRAHYNAVVAESRLTPHKNFIAEYQAVIEESKALGEKSFAGIARAMLSREFQIVELYEKALQMADQAIEDLESERGTLHYFHALLQKAHVLIDLGRAGETVELLKECEMASFPSIQAARTLLQVSLDPAANWDKTLEDDLMPTWKNRMPPLLAQRGEVSGEGPATELERALLRLAYNGPIAKWDLIAKLYPQESDSLVSENRFKNLLGRLRKKHPGVLVCEEGRYFLAKMPAREMTT